MKWVLMFYWSFAVNTLGFSGGYVSAEVPTVFRWTPSKLVGLTIKHISVSSLCNYSLTIGGVAQNPILPCSVRARFTIDQFGVKPIVQVPESAVGLSGNGGLIFSTAVDVDNIKDFVGDLFIPLEGTIVLSLFAMDDPALVMAVRNVDISFFSLDFSVLIGYEYKGRL